MPQRKSENEFLRIENTEFSHTLKFLLRGHPQTTWFSNWDFLTPPPPYVATFQIADVVFSRTFLDPPSPPEVATWFVDDP